MLEGLGQGLFFPQGGILEQVLWHHASGWWEQLVIIHLVICNYGKVSNRQPSSGDSIMNKRVLPMDFIYVLHKSSSCSAED